MFSNYKKEVTITIDLKIHCTRLRTHYFKIMGVLSSSPILRKITPSTFLAVLDRTLLARIALVLKLSGTASEVAFLNRWLCDINTMGFIQ